MIGLALFIYDHGWSMLKDLFTPAPQGRTLQERYPARPGAFVTSYSSIDLTEDWFVKEGRRIR